MKNKLITQIIIIIIVGFNFNYAQSGFNCFLDDFYPINAYIPPSVSTTIPTDTPDVFVTIQPSDTLGKISRYLFGNALAVWIGNVTNDPVLVDHIRTLNPTLIRYPGGSWSDIFFWDGTSPNVPDSLIDGTNDTKYKFYPQYGMGSWPTTVDNYYYLCDDLFTGGLITVNYGYARYGTAQDPVAQAAHYAAEWVRYDDGHTKYWEIGNENAGPWEAGWKIDTLLNNDGQPELITGELYGQHFNIIADSMRAAAAELGITIYIGGQIMHFDGTNSWNIPEREWNQGFFQEVGDNADFYVIHNYIGTQGNANHLLNQGQQVPNDMMDFIEQDIIDKNATPRPIAMTEWNMSVGGIYKTSFINGMQATIIINELIKRNYGMSCRWLLVTGEDGMFYQGSDPNIPLWNPRPEFYYLYYLQLFTGDHSVASTVSGNSGILAYSTMFGTNHIGLVLVNKSTSEHTVIVSPSNYGVGSNYYVYSLTGGTNNGTFSQYVYVNDYPPSDSAWGPLNGLESIPAWSYPITHEIKIVSPPRSTQLILIEPGQTMLSVDNQNQDGNSQIARSFTLHQNYPNPFNPGTTISFELTSRMNVTLNVYDVEGRLIQTIINKKQLSSGKHSYNFNAGNLASGVYYYALSGDKGYKIRKMILLK